MLDNLFTSVFGRSKGRTSGSSSRGSQDAGSSQPSSGPSSMTGPFSTSMIPQMPQPPSLPYPVAPYPATAQTANSYYPSLPFSQPPSLPPKSTGHISSTSNQFNPLDSVPFEAKLSNSKTVNLAQMDTLFKEMRQEIEKVDRADHYLRSRESDYDFRTEQGLMYQ